MHCVSEDLRMGKGIAVLFKKKFGGVEELQAQGSSRLKIEYLMGQSKPCCKKCFGEKST